MSIKSAVRFLSAASQDQVFRERFSAVQSPEDFLSVSQAMGYSFTTHELRAVVIHKSRGAQVRRDTGVWRWLRNVSWV